MNSSAPIYTPVTLWQGFDASLALDTSVISEYESGGILLSEMYFSGRALASNKRPRIYGVFAMPKGAVNPPAVLVAADENTGVDYGLLKYLCGLGFAAFGFDYTGEATGKPRFTVYPEEISYANAVAAGRHKDFCDGSAKENCWYEWTAAARYALSQLKTLLPESRLGAFGMRKGSLIAWQLAAVDERISASAAIFFAGWERYRGSGSAEEIAPELDDETQRYLAGIAVESYAGYVRVPMLYLSSTNSDLTYMDRAYSTLARVPAHVPLVYSFSPRFYNLLGDGSSMNIGLFFRKYLMDEDISKPKAPKLTVENKEGSVLLRLQCDAAAELSEAGIYYCLDGSNPVERDWIRARAFKAGDGIFEASVPSSSFSVLTAYPHVTYADGFTLSGTMCGCGRSAADLPYCRIPGKVIYQGTMGEDTFVAYPLLAMSSAAEVFMTGNPVQMAEGPLGIKGVTARVGALASYKIGTEQYAAKADSLLRLDIYSAQPQKLTIIIYENKGTPSERKYRAEAELLGGEMWQPFTLSAPSFKSADNLSMKSFENISMAAFYTAVPAVYNNILWV